MCYLILYFRRRPLETNLDINGDSDDPEGPPSFNANSILTSFPTSQSSDGFKRSVAAPSGGETLGIPRSRSEEEEKLRHRISNNFKSSFRR